MKTGIAAALKPLLCDTATAIDLRLELGVLGVDVGDGVVQGHVVLFEAACHCLFLVVQMSNVLDGALQDGSLVLVAVGHETSKLVDALVDRLTAAALNCLISMASIIGDMSIPSL